MTSLWHCLLPVDLVFYSTAKQEHDAVTNTCSLHLLQITEILAAKSILGTAIKTNLKRRLTVPQKLNWYLLQWPLLFLSFQLSQPFNCSTVCSYKCCSCTISFVAVRIRQYWDVWYINYSLKTGIGSEQPSAHPKLQASQILSHYLWYSCSK